MIGKGKRQRISAMLVLACLLFGVSANVLSAWIATGVLQICSTPMIPLAYAPVPSAPVELLGLPETEVQPTEFMRYSAFGISYWVMHAPPDIDDKHSIGISCHLWQAGIPLPSLQCQGGARFSRKGVFTIRFSTPSWWAEGIDVASVRLPVRPAWPGFIINTFFYALLALSVHLMVISRRARKRLRKQQCPACGYSLLGLSQPTHCPECGAASSNP